MRRPSTGIGWIAAMVLVPCLARAQASDEDARIHAAVEMRQHGDDEGALRLLRELFAHSHSARAEAQMAFAEQALGRWVEADAHLREALGSADPWIVQHRALLDGSITTIGQHLGTLDVRGGVPGADIQIDGRTVGTLPLAQPIRIVVGTVTLRVRASGFEPVERRVVVEAGSLARESVELVALVSGPPTSPVLVSSAPPSALPPVRLTPLRQGSNDPRVALAIASGVIAVVAAGTGLGANIAREIMVGTYNSTACETDGQTRRTNCGYMLGDIDHLEIAEIVGYATGGAFAIASVIFAATAAHGGSRAQAQVTCGRGPGTLGISCGASF